VYRVDVGVGLAETGLAEVLAGRGGRRIRSLKCRWRLALAELQGWQQLLLGELRRQQMRSPLASLVPPLLLPPLLLPPLLLTSGCS
jgi:hypothetical protein